VIEAATRYSRLGRSLPYRPFGRLTLTLSRRGRREDQLPEGAQNYGTIQGE